MAGNISGLNAYEQGGATMTADKSIAPCAASCGFQSSMVRSYTNVRLSEK